MPRLPIPLAVAIALTGFSAVASPISHDELTRRATAGDVVAERDLGQSYLDGQGVAQDVAAGVAWLEKAAKLRDPFAAYLLGEHYESLPQTADNHNQMVSYYRQAAELGHTTAQVKIAQMLLERSDVQGSGEQDKAGLRSQALALLAFAGNAGNGVANTVLGNVYAQGAHGVAVDLKKAESSYRKAAAEEQVAAYVWLAHYYLGQGHDTMQGTEYLAKAGQAQVPGAALQLANRYLKGEGAPKDTAKAIEWAQRAQAQHDPDAGALLAQMQPVLSANKAQAIEAPPHKERLAAAPINENAPAETHVSRGDLILGTGTGKTPASAIPSTAAVPVAVVKPLRQAPVPGPAEPLNQRITQIEKRMNQLEQQNTHLQYEISQNELDVTMLQQNHYEALAEADAGRHAHQARADAWRHVMPKKPGPQPRPPVSAAAILSDDTRGLKLPAPPTDPVEPMADGDAPSVDGPVVEANVAAPPVHIDAPSITVADVAVTPLAPKLVAPVESQPLPVHEAPPAAAHIASPPVAAEHTVASVAQPAQAAEPLPAATTAPKRAPSVLPSRVIDHDADVANEQGVEAVRRGEYEKATELFRRAAMSGNPRALNNLAMAYFRGLGVERNIREAVDCFERAVHAGDGGAAYNLGYIYQYGVGVVPDRARAIGWYRRASELGNANAHRMLGELLSQAAQPNVSTQG